MRYDPMPGVGVKSDLAPDELEEAVSQSKVSYASMDFEDFLKELFLKKHLDEGNSVVKWIDQPLWIRSKDHLKFISELEKTFDLVVTQPGSNIVLTNDNYFIILYVEREEVNKIWVYSRKQQEADAIMELAEKYRDSSRKLSVNWVYDEHGSSITLTEEMTEQIDASLYPFVKDFDTFAQRFFESNSNILVLQGPPGTGKTTFIKHLIEYSDKQAYLTYNANVLSNDSLFANFMRDDDAATLIIEDADLFLKSRAEGNGMVARFLNIGDGIIKLKNKKLIFSTNLPNLKDIDAALVRPGRCFEVMHFRLLTKVEAETVAKIHNRVLPVDQAHYTLAEVFNAPVAMPTGKGRGMGFV